MRKFNVSILILTITIYGLLLIPAYFAAFALEGGAVSEDDRFIQLFAVIFDILRFPTHTLFWTFITQGGIMLFTLGLIVNAFFYGFILARISVITKRITAKKEI